MKLVLQNVRKTFGEKHVLSDLNFQFEKGKIYGLLGRNGAGKTTLFNCLGGEIQTDSGTMELINESTSRHLEIDDVGYVYSLPMLPEFLTGYEFVRFFIDVNVDVIEGRGNDIDGLFDMMHMTLEDRHKLIKQYSHGMKNKVQMMLFLLMKPAVILLDEPLTSFDVIVASEMKQLLRDIKKDHILIFSTHILQLATDLCDELVILNHGSLTRISPDILTQPDFEAQIIELLRHEGEEGSQKENSDAGNL
ncbi:ABC-2 type transport system ATP-binding protein [Paenibacillus polysaccharolyticus]|uniref:ABC-2 type transport system ATP-binding protein n=1 Tax=Paenibacillus polysaccharolyticus TaxID=582692 RepID=A0A1G5D5M9_9BACL|nr:ABC transporter ATP-binding protein [Paenibacillus polysaccharolyticus]SCY09750.1 ABC-2 type transport system ATP-binding protein [Paenibacillus polysaccharolyticus]